MATYFKDTVEVTVFTEGAPTETQSFSYPLCMVPHNITANTIDSFGTVSALTSAGFAVNSPAYMMVQGSLSGIAPPDLVKIGRMDVDTITITVDTLLTEGEVISVNTNVAGVDAVVSYTVLVTDTTTTLIAAGLADALTAAFGGAGDPTFLASGATIVITPDTSSCSFGWNSITGTTPHTTITTQTSESYTTAIGDSLAEDDDVSFIIIESKVEADIKLVAAYTETLQLQQFLTSTDIVDVKDSGSTTNLALDLQGFAYDKTYMQYHPAAKNYFPECAWLSNFANLDPWTLYNPGGLVAMKGIPKITISEQEEVTLTARNVSWNKLERNQQYLKGGWASSGMFLDYQRFALWLKYASETALFNLKRKLNNLGRALPYSDDGARMMEQAIQKDVINVGIRGGRIADGTTRSEFGVIDLNPIVDFGARADQTDTNIANRIWDEGFIEVVMLSGIDRIQVKAYALTNRQFEANNA